MGERENRLAAVRDRLERAEATGDHTLLLAPDAVGHTRRLAEILSEGDLEARLLLGWAFFHQSLALGYERGEAQLDDAADMLIPCFVAGLDGLPERMLPWLAIKALPVARERYGDGPGTTETARSAETIALFRRIANVIPPDHRGWGGVRGCLANMLRARSERDGTAADLDEAIEIDRKVVRALPVTDSNRAVSLSNLGVGLHMRYERAGAMADLNEAIQVGRDAVETTEPSGLKRIDYLSNLGNALLERFDRTGVRSDLDEAIRVAEEAVAAAPAGHPNRAAVLSNLANAIQARSEWTAADPEQAVRISMEAVAAAGSLDAARYRANLGSALHHRFDRTGSYADLDEAIVAIAAAVEGTPAEDSARIGYLNNLGTALRARFDHTGVRADLDWAVDVGEEAAKAIPAGHTQRALVLSNLALMLVTRYRRAGGSTDLNRAIEIARETAAATPAGHPRRAAYLSNLEMALRTRFERLNDRADLDEAIDAGRAAVDAALVDDPGRAAYLAGLAASLRARVSADDPAPAGHAPSSGRRLRRMLGVGPWRGARGPLDEAITAARTSAEATPIDDPNWAGRISDLGNLLEFKYEGTGRKADLAEALSVYRRVVEVESAAPRIRIQTAHHAARLIGASDPGSAADLMETALRLLPELAPRRLGRDDQQYALRGLASLAWDAASFALAGGGTATARAERALRLLEAGRAVLFSQALETRDDLTDLREAHPDLATRFIELRDLLDRQGPGVPDGGNGPMSRPIDEAEHRRRLAEEFNATLSRIRGLDGFGSFGCPPSIEELLAQAAAGPVVYLNVSEYRSDALLLTREGITSLPLPGLNPDTLAEQIIDFEVALYDTTDDQRPGPRPGGERSTAQLRLMATLEWLWDVVAGPVLGALGFHRCPGPGEQWPRVWWVPGGMLEMLPIHAAGYHADPPGPERRSVLDRVVSSYTPTIRGLSYARRQAARAAAQSLPLGALVVAMPTTPGQKSLGAVVKEVRMLRAVLPDAVVLTEPSPGDDTVAAETVPTKANALAHLSDCAIAHFSCHGDTNLDDPSQSRLLLHDHADEPLTVAVLASARLEGARLAFLSACRTAITTFITRPELIGEPIHITGAFQLAGFPHVIGTLWEIYDRSALQIAETFYAHLSGENGLDPDLAPYALNVAIRKARDGEPGRSRVLPSEWVPFVHFGA